MRAYHVCRFADDLPLSSSLRLTHVLLAVCRLVKLRGNGFSEEVEALVHWRVTRESPRLIAKVGLGSLRNPGFGSGPRVPALGSLPR